MKKVRFLTAVSSVNGSYAGGSIDIIDATTAEQWRAGGLVEIITETVADAPAPDVETAAFKRNRRK